MSIWGSVKPWFRMAIGVCQKVNQPCVFLLQQKEQGRMDFQSEGAQWSNRLSRQWRHRTVFRKRVSWGPSLRDEMEVDLCGVAWEALKPRGPQGKAVSEFARLDPVMFMSQSTADVPVKASCTLLKWYFYHLFLIHFLFMELLK